MSLARLVVTAVKIEGRTKAEVARECGISRRWVHELIRRVEAEGDRGLEPRSRRPHRSPHRTPAVIEDEIVALRKELSGIGVDAGAHTIRAHLERCHRREAVPSVATIWRILSRRGFVTPQPQKRPRSSFVRFEAAMPNERWQADITHWRLADGTESEILNVVDDHSRFLVASQARCVFKAADVVATFHEGARTCGFPASLLTDNGAVFTAAPRGGGRCAIEVECDLLGIRLTHSRPYHPQTCGKIERFHQTLKRWLRRQPRARSLEELQAQLEVFRTSYNELRPHRAIGRRTPAEAFAARPKATPTGLAIPMHCRVRRDRIDG
ncbi:MAG: IS481 family transposase, partial [Pseudonocardiaceae bacterium]